MEVDTESQCPICNKSFPQNEIEQHANKCIFLNSEENESTKRKRSLSPAEANKVVAKEATKLAPVFAKSSGKSEQNGKPDHPTTVPLSKQIIPTNLDEFYGQEHLLGKKTMLYAMLSEGEIPPMILWGPPGSGKTSIANIVRNICKQDNTKYRYASMCAASEGVKDVEKIVTKAKEDSKVGKKTVLFMDEIHRFNKRQQDVFLKPMEQGDIILIGATTENPSFSLNSAVLSRCRVLVLNKLEKESILKILLRAADELNLKILSEENSNVDDGNLIEEAALEWMADTSDGDARIAVNNLELIMKSSSNENKVITLFDIKESVKKSHVMYDSKGEEHYNTMSAVHKSIRASDPNAALYWVTRMMLGGENPDYIARRLVRAASEDIGEADPQALILAVSTLNGVKLIGMPESDVLLAQCAVYLAKAPKSRAIDSALAKAKKAIAECKGALPGVPMHLRNAPTKLMKDLGYGASSENASNLPTALKDVDFFN